MANIVILAQAVNPVEDFTYLLEFKSQLIRSMCIWNTDAHLSIIGLFSAQDRLDKQQYR